MALEARDVPVRRSNIESEVKHCAGAGCSNFDGVPSATILLIQDSR
jgi:hypothetical protein